MKTGASRNRAIDIIKGILIICVVSAHFYGSDSFHDIIFLFHMPLFFVISGFLLRRENLLASGYVRKRAISLLIPYVVYWILDFIFVLREYSIKWLLIYAWGGRKITGVYWYVTCFIAALFVFSFLIKHFSDRKIQILILVGGA